MQLTIPPWITLPTLLAFPLYWLLFPERRYRRLKTAPHNNLCPTCNYDLRAHKAGDKCPECGTTISPQAQQSRDR